MNFNNTSNEDGTNLSRRMLLKATTTLGAVGLIGFPIATGRAAAASGTMTVRSGTGTQVVGYRAGSEAGAFPTSTPNVPADLTWIHPFWSTTNHTFDNETRWIWHCNEESSTGQTVDGDPTYYVREPISGDVVEFEEQFSVPGTVTSATLYVTADNGHEAYLNGTPVSSKGVNDSGGVDWEDSDLKTTFVPSTLNAWQTVSIQDVTNELNSGANTLRVLGANEHMSEADGEQQGTVTSNPGGVIYELDVEYEVVECDECTSGSELLEKYEFEDCDFVREMDKGDDAGISYESMNYVSKDDEECEPIAVTFNTDYCELDALVKAGGETYSVDLTASEGTVTIDLREIVGDGEKLHAISNVRFYCVAPEAESPGSRN